MPSLQHLPADASPETIAAILDSDGALILDDLISPAQVARGEKAAGWGEEDLLAAVNAREKAKAEASAAAR